MDIAAGNKLVDMIKPLAKATSRAGNFISVCVSHKQDIMNDQNQSELFPPPSGCAAELGGFAGLFDLKAAGFVDPILVSGTDGVGTKLKVLFNNISSIWNHIETVAFRSESYGFKNTVVSTDWFIYKCACYIIRRV